MQSSVRSKMRFLQKSHESAHHLFFLLFRSTLHRCATLTLYQRLSVLDKSDDGSCRIVNDRDIDAAYKVSKKVGLKWVSKLRAATEIEMAILLQIAIETGRYFERIDYSDVDRTSKQALFDFLDHDDEQSLTSSNTGPNVEGGDNNIQAKSNDDNDTVVNGKKYNSLLSKTPFNALSTHLNVEENRRSIQNVENGTSSDWCPLPATTETSNLNSKNVIPLCSNLSHDKLQSISPDQLYGVPRNTLLEHTSTVNCHPIIGKEKFVKFQIEALDTLGHRDNTLWQFDWNVIQSASRRNHNRIHLVDSISPRKRQKLGQEEQNLNSQAFVTSPIGNANVADDLPPPSHQSMLSSWSIEDAYKTFNSDEIKNLVDTMIHNEEEDNDPNKVQHGCVGALKFTGNSHLWEQVKAGNWNGPMDEPISEGTNDVFVQKRRKKAYLKAKRQRLYPNSETNKKVEHINKLSSKISYTESSGKHFIELDLGECIVSLQSHIKDDNNKPISRKIAFKSLEISLSEEKMKA